MAPFFSTGLYEGPVAKVFGGSDFSLFVGLPVSGLLYWVLMRNVDVAAEREIAEREASALEEEAVHHQRPELRSES
jgi:cytosine/uracil/thiamine/allantoin permease